MPNRIIKESLCTSEKISQLTDFEFRVWIGLILQADDLGHGDARAAIIKGSVFPLRERITLKEISDAISTLAAHSCIDLYEVGGKSYYAFPNWGEHQRVRNIKPKYPSPNNLPQSAAICGNSPQSAATRVRAESNPIQYEYEYEYEIESESNARARETAFDTFWSAYPKKVGKVDAKKVFEKVKVPLETLLTAIERQKCGSQWTKDGGQYIPNPATWLRQGRWDDEVYVQQDTRTSASTHRVAKKPEEYMGASFLDD